MQRNFQTKISFWLRLAGWLCLLPASAYLYLLQNTASTGLAYFCGGELVLIVLFAAFLLVTAKTDRWTQTRNLVGLLIFTILFVSLVVFIPIWFAYRNCRKMNRK